jgi:hypothetical protein
MRNGTHVSVLSVALEARPFGVAVGVVAICALLLGLAWSLPGRAADGVVLGVGTTLASMLSAARPHQPLVPLAVYAITILGCAGVAYGSSSPHEPAGGFWIRTIRLGGFWLAVPAAVGVAVVRRNGVSGVDLVACVAVFALVAAAALRRGRDLSVGYAAGLLVALAALVASAYGRAAGDGTVLAYPSGLTALIALGCAGRIGLDRGFALWQRLAAASIGAAALVAVESSVAFVAAFVGTAAYAIFRLRGIRMPRQLRESPLLATFHVVAPFVLLAGLWSASLVALPHGRHQAVDFVGVSALGLGRSTLATAPAEPTVTTVPMFTATGWLVVAALIIGAALVVWRVTGPGLPLWVPAVGLAMLTGVLASRSASTYGPSPAWVLVLGAELWVFCHGLRPDRDVLTQPPQDTHPPQEP